MNKLSLAVVSASIAGLTACGGGGGGSPSFLNFYSDSFVPSPNSTAQATLYQQPFSYTNDGAGTTTNVDLRSPSTGTLSFGFGSNTQLSSITLDSSESSFVINESNGALIPESTPFSEDLTATTTTAPLRLISGRTLDNSNYSSYGFWLSATNIQGTAGVGATFSTGLESSASAVPASGTAVYSGGSFGVYFAPLEGLYITESIVSSNVDFSARSLAISSLNTTASLQGTGPSQSAPLLNFAGSGSIGPGSASFTGTATVEAGLNGTFTGRFFGPSAQEMGGTFQFSTIGAKYIGGFGAAR